MKTKIDLAEILAVLLETYLTFFTCTAFLGLSWYILFVKFYTVRDATIETLRFLELLSIITTSMAHMLLLDLMYEMWPYNLVIQLRGLCGSFFSRLRLRKFDKCVRPLVIYLEKPSTQFVLFSEDGGGSIKLSFKRKMTLVVLFFTLTCLLMTIHIIINLDMVPSKRASQEILLALIRFAVDIVIFSATFLVCLSHFIYTLCDYLYGRRVWSRRIAYQVRVFRVAIFFGLVMLSLFVIHSSIPSADAIAILRRGILEEPCDPCEAEGLQLDPAFRRSWVLLDIMPWGFLERIVGCKPCCKKSCQKIGYIDEAEEVLVVSSLCSDGSKPKVFLERPEDSEMHGGPNPILTEVYAGVAKYHDELEKRYGTREKERSEGVIVSRDPKTGFIGSVEIAPWKLIPVNRIASSPKEVEMRSRWPSKHVLEVPLGRSAAYTVSCVAINHEELFLFPVKNVEDERLRANGADAPPLQQQESNSSSRSSKNLEEPAGNVVIILMDALSRQEVHRSLPGFVKWMREFRKRQAGIGKEGHLVFEPKAATTLGHSTPQNFCPYLTGTTFALMEATKQSNTDMMDRIIFNVAKRKYASALSTAFTVGFCHDFLEIMIGNSEPSSGTGRRLQGVDYYLYQPMCDLEYSGLHNNFEGPYSIFRRCIKGRQVHEHLFDYTRYLLRQQMHQRATTLACEGRSPNPDKGCGSGLHPGKFFFDLSYFLEGHEGSHRVIKFVDDALVDFMRHLEEDLHFFDDPLNTFIFASDHGNHMGPYFSDTYPGKFERATPALLFVIHPEVMRRVDLRKARPVGESLKNFEDRMKRLSTPLDLYMTLGDLAGVSLSPDKAFSDVEVPPASLFDPRTGSPIRNCFEFSTKLYGEYCSLNFCVDKKDKFKHTR